MPAASLPRAAGAHNKRPRLLTARLSGHQIMINGHALSPPLFVVATSPADPGRGPAPAYPGIEYLLEFLARVKPGDASRTAELQQRHPAFIIDGLRSTRPKPLPGDPRQLGRLRSRHPPARGWTSLRGSCLRIARHN